MPNCAGLRKYPSLDKHENDVSPFVCLSPTTRYVITQPPKKQSSLRAAGCCSSHSLRNAGLFFRRYWRRKKGFEPSSELPH
jgi:hypothetical protein